MPGPIRKSGAGSGVYDTELAETVQTIQANGGIPSGTKVSQLKGLPFTKLFDREYFPASLPTASLSNNSRDVWHGETLSNQGFNISFNRNEAGIATGYRLEKNGVQIGATANNTINLSNITSQIKLKGFVDHAASDRLASGSVGTNTITINPRHRLYGGAGNAFPTNAAEILAGSWVYENAGQLVIDTTNTATKIWFALRSAWRNLPTIPVIDIIYANSVLTYKKIGSPITVPLPTGSADYIIMGLTLGGPYDPQSTHKYVI